MYPLGHWITSHSYPPKVLTQRLSLLLEHNRVFSVHSLISVNRFNYVIYFIKVIHLTWLVILTKALLFVAFKSIWTFALKATHFVNASSLTNFNVVHVEWIKVACLQTSTLHKFTLINVYTSPCVIGQFVSLSTVALVWASSVGAHVITNGRMIVWTFVGTFIHIFTLSRGSVKLEAQLTLRTGVWTDSVGALEGVLTVPPLASALIYVNAGPSRVHLVAFATGTVVVTWQVDALLIETTFKRSSNAFINVSANATLIIMVSYNNKISQ